RTTNVGTRSSVGTKCEQGVIRLLALLGELRRFPEVGDAVDTHEGVVAVHEDPQLELAGEDELAVVDAGAVDEGEVHLPPLQLAQFCPSLRGHREHLLTKYVLTVRSVPGPVRSMGRSTLLMTSPSAAR